LQGDLPISHFLADEFLLNDGEEFLVELEKLLDFGLVALTYFTELLELLEGMGGLGMED
jgi:hypothetical protein